jgi:hypothetical protein
MKIFMFALSIALLPAVAGAGVIFGNVSLVDKDKTKLAGDTLVVALTPAEQPDSIGLAMKSELKDTTDAYSAFNLFVEGSGSYKLHLLGKSKGVELIEPISVQVYEEAVEFNLILTHDKSGTAKYPYTVRRK